MVVQHRKYVITSSGQKNKERQHISDVMFIASTEWYLLEDDLHDFSDVTEEQYSASQ